MPRCKGGTDEATNIQLLCANCHEDKTIEDLKDVRRCRPLTDEHKAKLRRIFGEIYSGPRRAEMIRKNSDSLKARWAEPVQRAKYLEAIKLRTARLRAEKLACQ